jgi:hypothetical protein
MLDAVNVMTYEEVLGRHGARRLEDESDEDDIPEATRKEDDVIERAKLHLKNQAEERIGRIKFKANRSRSQRSESGDEQQPQLENN